MEPRLKRALHCAEHVDANQRLTTTRTASTTLANELKKLGSRLRRVSMCMRVNHVATTRPPPAQEGPSLAWTTTEKSD
jgi:hypothetical protein